MKMRAFLSFLFILFLLGNLWSQTPSGTPRVNDGAFLFEKKDSDNEMIYRLDGQWEFYWNLFLPPIQKDRSEVPIPRHIEIPGSWHDQTDYPVYGYGTLRLEISGLEPGRIYSLYMPDLVTSYRLFIDGREHSSNGIVGKNRGESQPQNLPRIVAFSADEKVTEILIHVSNYDYRKSGIWRSLFLGGMEGISFYRDSHILIEAAIASLLLAIALFHIGIYAYRNQEKAEFLFGLICLTFIIRILCTGEQLLTFFLPSFSWEVLRKLEYIPFYGSAPLLALFMAVLFPSESSRFFTRIYVGVSFVYGLFFWIFPVRISNHLIPYAEGFMVLGLVYAFWILFRALMTKREEAPFMAAAYLIFTIAVLNDILYASQLLQTMYISPLGFIIFIFIQSQMLIRRYSHSFFQRDLLAKSRDIFRTASITDSLTGLYNVRYLHSVLEREIENSPETGSPLSLVMADVDDFKKFNDTWGHKQGDQVLKKMGTILRGSAREKDSPCRYGGEEFAVVLPDTALEEAVDVAERMRTRFENNAEQDERMQGITVSIGVAQYRASESADHLIERADRALYRAKHLGKNRVVRATGPAHDLVKPV
jgi:diguanylate cyclase (GGDEF)-like protein